MNKFELNIETLRKLGEEQLVAGAGTTTTNKTEGDSDSFPTFDAICKGSGNITR